MLMQKGNQHFVGLDIGTSQVRCVIASLADGDVAPTIVGVGTSPNLGVRKGSVVNIQETVQAVDVAIDEAERMSGYQISSATVNVNGAHIKGMNSKGVIAVGAANREITAEDILRVEEAATVVQLPPNREIIQVFAKNYVLDGQENIKDPLGMSGVRLEVEAHVVTAATPSLRNIDSVMEATGTKSNGRLLSGLAATEAVINRQQRENGVAVIDFGASTTNLTVLEEGDVQYVAVIPMGSNNITNDLAIGLRTELEVAEKVKLESSVNGPGNKRSKKSKKMKFTVNRKEFIFTQEEIEDVMQARLDEIFEHVDKELGRVNRSGQLPGGVILAGGGSKLTGLEEYAKESLRLPVRIAKPSGFSGLSDKVDGSEFSTAMGLMLHDLAMNLDSSKGPRFNISTSGVWKSITNIVGNLKP